MTRKVTMKQINNNELEILLQLLNVCVQAASAYLYSSTITRLNVGKEVWFLDSKNMILTIMEFV